MIEQCSAYSSLNRTTINLFQRPVIYYFSTNFRRRLETDLLRTFPHDRTLWVTSRHVASLRVVLTLFTLGAARLCGVLSHATPSDTAAVGGALYAKRSDGRTIGHPDFNR